MNATDVVWSINIMVLILLVGVSFVIYWIFKYDDWYPNSVDPIADSMHTSSSATITSSRVDDYPVDGENETLEMGAESYSY